jgi:hypothetical protein
MYLERVVAIRLLLLPMRSAALARCKRATQPVAPGSIEKILKSEGLPNESGPPINELRFCSKVSKSESLNLSTVFPFVFVAQKYHNLQRATRKLHFGRQL